MHNVEIAIFFVSFAVVAVFCLYCILIIASDDDDKNGRG